MDNLSRKSAWNHEQLEHFLRSTKIPARISVIDGSYPFICSVWFEYLEGTLRIVTHRNSKLAKSLRREGRCAFEVGANEPPYLGVRGKADVQAQNENPELTLRRVIKRYLGGSNLNLATWLLGRAQEEIEFVLYPTWATCWDYQQRMDASD